MKNTPRSLLGAGVLMMASLSACSSPQAPAAETPRRAIDDEHKVLPVRFVGPENNGSYLHGDHGHLFPESLVGRAESMTIVHLPIALELKLWYLVRRKEHVEMLLRRFRKYMNREAEVLYELELRMIPDEIRRIRREVHQAVQVDEETDEV